MILITTVWLLPP